MDTTSDLRSIIKNRNEVQRRIEATSPSILETFAIFIRRSALVVINQTTITQLLDKLKNEADAATRIAEEQGPNLADVSGMLLDMIAKHRPELFIPHLSELERILVDEQDDRLCQTALFALSTVALSSPATLPKDR